MQVPVLFAYGTEDVGAAGDVIRVRAATATQDKPVITSNGPEHGAGLVAPVTGDPKVEQAVLQFIHAITSG